MPRSCIQDDRSSTLSFELADPSNEAGESETWRTATRVAGKKALVIDFSLLMAMDAASRHRLSRYDAGETRIVGTCEPAAQLAQSIGGISGASVPGVCEPCGVWISLEAGKKR